jgi:Peptidase family S41
MRHLFAILSVVALAAPAAAQTTGWAKAARLDVLGGYQLLAASHPGMTDPHNPGFPTQLAMARDAGLKLAADAHDQAGYANALGAFTAVLADGHAQLGDIPPPGPSKVEWPGFVAAWRGNRVVIHLAGPTSPTSVGSTIEQCDGRTMPALIRDRLLYSGFRPGEAGHWWARTPRAFTFSSDLNRAPPRVCTFRLADGHIIEKPLAWSVAPANLDSLLRTASDGERTPIGLSEARPGMFLVGMPDFDPNAEGVIAWRRLYEMLKARRLELLRAKALVIDLRYNNGGSSEWSRHAARLIWGKDAVDVRMERYNRRVGIWWRASLANIAYMAAMEQKVRSNGQVAVADDVHMVATGMKTAAAKRQDYYVEAPPKLAYPSRGKLPPTDFATPVYVITPGRCASACLDALDTFKRFATVKLIGAPTSADSTYMEVRVTPLPSGQGMAVIPVKMWVGRPRAAGEVYRPDIQMDDADWSTANFLKRIQEDLVR